MLNIVHCWVICWALYTDEWYVEHYTLLSDMSSAVHCRVLHWALYTVEWYAEHWTLSVWHIKHCTLSVHVIILSIVTVSQCGTLQHCTYVTVSVVHYFHSMFLWDNTQTNNNAFYLLTLPFPVSLSFSLLFSLSLSPLLPFLSVSFILLDKL